MDIQALRDRVSRAKAELEAAEAALAKAIGVPPHHYRITVTSTATPTHAVLRKAYDWVRSFWDGRSRLHLHESLRDVTPSKGNKTVFVKNFDGPVQVTTEEVIEWARSNGYRLAFPCEREAFVRAFPDLQREFWIVDFGSFISFSFRGEEKRHVPVFGENGKGRVLSAIKVSPEQDDWWGPNHYFLLVRDE